MPKACYKILYFSKFECYLVLYYLSMFYYNWKCYFGDSEQNFF